MTSKTTANFRACLDRLPKSIRRQAYAAYRLFQENPQHPSLRFKRLRTKSPIHSVRISIDCRALGIIDGDEVVWFWIGTHAEYDQLLKTL